MTALAPSLVRAAAGTYLPSPAGPPGEIIQGGRDLHDHLTVEVFVDDKGPFRFVVDTGADRSVIADDVAVQLGLLAGPVINVQGIARAINVPSVPLRSLRVHGMEIEKLRVPILARSLLGADGYLGLDVIDGHAVTFDFQAGRLLVRDSMPSDNWSTLYSDGLTVRVNGEAGRLALLNCRVDGVPVSAFIDSGAEMSIGNLHLFEALSRHGGKYLSDEVVPVLGVTGGSAGGRMSFIDQIRFGPVRFNRSVLLIADLPVFDVWGLGDRPALMIGMNFLRATSSVTIDYGSKEIRFKLAQYLMASRV